MYVPRLYRPEERAELVDFLRRNNFAALVSRDTERLVATHAPVEIEETDEALTIYGHFARANPQWRSFGTQEVLLIFQGPHTYISPRWYGHVNVPTWNYQIAHVYGTVRELHGEALRGLLSRLVGQHEGGSPYRLETLPEDFIQREMQAVFGFALTVTRLEGSYKLSQNRNAEDHASIVAHLEQRADEASHAVAAAMRQHRGPAA